TGIGRLRSRPARPQPPLSRSPQASRSVHMTVTTIDRATTSQPAIDQAKLDALVGSALSDIAGAYGGVMISVGNKLGLYKAMAGAGPLSSEEVASRAGCAERYVRE